MDIGPIPVRFVFMFGVLLVFSLLVLDEKRTIKEKMQLLFYCLVFYILFRVMTGATLDEIVSPLSQIFSPDKTIFE